MKGWAGQGRAWHGASEVGRRGLACTHFAKDEGTERVAGPRWSAFSRVRVGHDIQSSRLSRFLLLYFELCFASLPVTYFPSPSPLEWAESRQHRALGH